MAEREASCWKGWKAEGMDGWWEERSLPEKIVLGIGLGLLLIGLAFLFGWIVMLLWNWLMPEIFGLKRVSYWQAWGLLLLSAIFFKGSGGSSGGKSDRKRKQELRRHLRQGEAAERAEEGLAGEGGEGD